MLMLILSASIVGCAAGGSALQRLELATTIANIEPLFQRTTSSLEANWTKFNAAEQDTLEKSYQSLVGVHTQIKSHVAERDFESLILDLAYLESTYLTVKMAYISSRDVVMMHLPEFPQVTQMELSRVDIRMKNLDKVVSNALAEGNESETIANMQRTLLMAAEMIQVFRMNKALMDL